MRASRWPDVHASYEHSVGVLRYPRARRPDRLIPGLIGPNDDREALTDDQQRAEGADVKKKYLGKADE